jgi:AcrR family transcriptional regulator
MRAMQRPAFERPPARPRGNRREDLVDAAVRVFAEQGVVATSVDDIVRAAGVAKGTYYLYFESRDAIVTAVAERLVGSVAAAMTASLEARDRPAADRIRGVARAMTTVGAGPSDRELIELIHEPANLAIHDRLTGAITTRVAAEMAAVIEDGIAAGEFPDQDPRVAASFVLATFGAVHDMVTSPDELEPVLEALNRFVLRGLGLREAAS